MDARTETATPDYARVAQAIRYLNDNQTDQPGLEEVARATGLSPFHFQRLFRRWAGVSPKQYLQFLTVEHAKSLLAASGNVLDASFDAGLSGPGRLHDHFVTISAITPGEYRTGGAGLTLRWGVADTPYGPALLALTARGLCALFFLDDPADGADAALEDLTGAWPEAVLKRDDRAAEAAARQIRQAWNGQGQIPLHLSGTNFQIQVWQALLSIPEGQVTTYGGLAQAIGRPGAARAVGQAVGRNPVAWLIPCHRVIQASGALGGYRWDAVRKQAMLAREWAGTSAGEAARTA